MVERYSNCEWDEGPYQDENGDFVAYEDYAKLADLCERMATLLKYVPYISTPSGKSIRAAVAEWEAMK